MLRDRASEQRTVSWMSARQVQRSLARVPAMGARRMCHTANGATPVHMGGRAGLVARYATSRSRWNARRDPQRLDRDLSGPGASCPAQSPGAGARGARARGAIPNDWIAMERARDTK